MRTTKRFTPTVLARFAREGRGTGTYTDYLPWHRVSRGDPSSIGRSHLINWHDRLREVLSDIEADVFRFATALGSQIVDIREQYKLSLDPAAHELRAYDVRISDELFKGTLAIAKEMGIKHPATNGGGATCDWIMTTDLLITLRNPDGSYRLLAIADKPKQKLKRRSASLLAVERAYWQARGVQWLLITPNDYEEAVALTMRRIAPWALGEPVTRADLKVAIEIGKASTGYSQTRVLEDIGALIGTDNDRHMRSLWQAVWYGLLPIDLRRGWRPHVPLKHISLAEFETQNPVLSRRSAWI
ncbi:MAG: transposase [Burkholderiales bacterium]|nr:MAG: transposase [Burkholderiales bacterium]